jgi:hypothetical protein
VRAERTTGIVAALEARRRDRETLAALARHAARPLARLLDIPGAVAADIATSSRLAARAGSRLRGEPGFEQAPVPPEVIARWIEDPSELEETVVGIGLCVRLGQLQGVLMRTDIEALKRRHGERAVAFALKHRSRPAVDAGIDLLDLQDAAAVSRQGRAELAAWVQAEHRASAILLADLLPDGPAPLLDSRRTGLLIEAWSAAG